MEQHPQYKDWNYIGQFPESDGPCLVYQRGEDVILCKTTRRFDGIGTRNPRETLERIQGRLANAPETA